MNDLEKVRVAIGDRVKADENLISANGELVDFQVRHENIWDVNVYLDDVLTTTGITVSGIPGVIAFATAPADGIEVRVTFKYAAFSDIELQQYIDDYDVDQAIIMALEGILSSVARQRDYKEADSEVKNSQVFAQVEKLLTYWNKKVSNKKGVTKGRRIHEQYKSTEPTDADLSRLM